jgi:hypothetical protein
LAEPLSELLDHLIMKNSFPSSMKLADITPVPKCSSATTKEQIRPISILPVVGKIYEKCLNSQLTDNYFKDRISKYLSPYRKHYSCQTALLHLIEDWKRELDNGLTVGVIVLDLSKAFDSLPHSLLFAKLRAYGFNEDSLCLMESYLTKIDDCFSSWEKIINGVPQGSIIGPILFNIFINDFFYTINKASSHSYADGTQLHYSNKDPIVVVNTLNEELKEASTWYSINGMKANPDKFHAMRWANLPIV